VRVWGAFLGAAAVLVIGSRATAGTPPVPRDNSLTPQKPSVAVPKRCDAATPQRTDRAAPQRSDRAAPKRADAAIVHRTAARIPASRDNGTIAVRGPGGLYLVDPARATLTKVAGTADMDEPAWSPDGRLLAVDRTDKSGTSVYTIRPNGTQPQLVLRNASSPTWSADGTQIFVERHGVSDDPDSPVFFTVRPDGSDAQPVNFDDGAFRDAREIAWPTDGDVIAFLGDGSDAGPASLDSSEAAWSPDGTQLAFSSSGLWVVDANGGTPKLLASGDFGRPSWGTFTGR